MPSSSPPNLLEYAYEYAGNHATTGLFACVPQGLDFEAAFAELIQRPMDSFLHRHLLLLARQLNPQKRQEMALKCHGCADDSRKLPENALLASLLMESGNGENEFAADIANGLRHIASLWESALDIPQFDQRSVAVREWSRIFNDNIHRHLPLSDLSHPPLYQLAELEPFMKPAIPIRDMFRPGNDTQEVDADKCRETAASALEALEAVNLLIGPEMRHEASLSPIALLRKWRVDAVVRNGRLAHRLSGEATAYGRGLSLAAARVSCLMEIVERACAYASFAVDEAGAFVASRKRPMRLTRNSWANLEAAGMCAVDPYSLGAPERSRNCSLHWLEAETAAGTCQLVPASAVFLFCNLDEPEFFTVAGSTGLAAGDSRERARYAALMEIMERHAHATTPYFPEACFRLASRDERIRGLLDDYSARHIYPQFQDITTDLGVPAYRCFVVGADGCVAQATGADLNGARAALSALTETPWPYSWASPAPFGKPSLRPDVRLPTVYLEDLPDYGYPAMADNLALLEKTLRANGHMPAYVDISRMDLPFAVCRAFVPGLEIISDFDLSSPPGKRLLARWLRKRQPVSAGTI